MRLRRIGLVLALILAIANLAPALDIQPDPSTGQIGVLPVVAAAVAAILAVTTMALMVPAWRGRHGAARGIAIIQLAGILQAAPIFFLPVQVIPAGAVVFAALGTLASMIAFTLILYDSSVALLGTAAVIVTVALYAGMVAGASALLPIAAERSVQTAAAIVVALLFVPILTLMRRTVAKSLYGGRADPAGTARRINHANRQGEGAIQTAIEETRRALRFPRLELVDRGSTVAVAEEARAAGTTVPMPVDADAGLAFRVTLRPGEGRLHRDDRTALELVAGPLALLLRESALIAELRAARADAARARESERATIHRELHDGLGSLLTGASFRVDAARKQLSDGAADAAENLAVVGTDLRAAIGEVRRVVYGLRPVELEQRSLWMAIVRRADAVGADLHLPESPPELSPAVELAIYRIVTEAIANIERHAPGSDVQLDVETDDRSLRVRVRNDGDYQPPVAEGIGVRSMRDRAEELGGQFSAGPVLLGWLVRVELPLR